MEKNKQAEILKRVLQLEKQITNKNCSLERLLVEQYTSAPVPPTCKTVVREYPEIIPEVQVDKVKAIVPSLIFWPWFLIYYFGIWSKEKKADIERIRNSEEYKAKCAALDAEFDKQQESFNKEYEEKKRIYDTETLPQYEKALHEWEEQHKEKVDKTRKELHAAQKELHEIYNTTKIVPVQYRNITALQYICDMVSTSDYDVKEAIESYDKKTQRDLNVMQIQAQQTANELAYEQNALLDKQNAIASKARRDANIASAIGAVQHHNTNKTLKKFFGK